MIGSMRCTLSLGASLFCPLLLHSPAAISQQHKHTLHSNGLGYYDFAKQFAISLMPVVGFTKCVITAPQMLIHVHAIRLVFNNKECVCMCYCCTSHQF